MTDLYNYPKYSCPYKRGKKYYFYKNNGLQNQSVLYVQDTLDGEARVFMDPNTLSADGTTAIGVSAFSESGLFWAHGLSKKGSDWQTIYVKSTEDGAAALTDELQWVKFSSIAWTHDDKGFFYCRYPTPKQTTDAGTETERNVDQQVYYHVLGTSQSADKLIFAAPEEPEWMFGVEVSDDGKSLLITVSKDCDPVNRLFLADLVHTDISKLTGPISVNKIVDNFEAEYSYLANNDNIFFFKTNLNAPKYKIVSIDVAAGYSSLKEVIPQSEKNVLSYVAPINHDKMLVVYMRDVVDVVQLHEIATGKFIKEFTLPTLGTINALSGRREHTEFFYQFTSFLHPGTIYHYKFSEDKMVKFRDAEIKDYDSSQFETQQVFYESKDGTKIPMFIVHKKGLKRDGNNPVMLYGYGGFNIAIQPYFSTFRLPWMQNFNGIFAVANIRGGGEYGEEWHQAGTKSRKQNVFDDFQYAAKYLIDEKWTRPERVAIFGGSNGGLLVAACINQRPDLFGVAVAAVGVLDMLNFHRYTIGHAWTSDYGCADNKEDFDYLIKYSPLHNVGKALPGVQYPCTMLTTADHDDRVVPLHSYKYIGELQEVMGRHPDQKNPLVIRVETSAGHSAGKPTAKVIEENADIYAFISHCMGLEWN